jgi:hypothetical protein
MGGMTDPAPVTPTPPAPQSRTTITPRAPQMTAAQMLADNVATRVREIAAMASLVMLAKWGLLPGQWAAIVIAAIVLPIEITRQVGKTIGARAAALGAGSGAVAFVVLLHKALTWGAIATVAVAAVTGCSAQQQHRATAGVIVSSGGVVEGLRQSNRDAYVHATDALRARVQGEEYARQSEPIDTAFRARGRAIRDLTGVLYASARLNDRPDVTLAERAAAARDILEQLRDLTAILRDGSVLPPIPIPTAVDDAEAGLQSLATLVAGGAQ